MSKTKNRTMVSMKLAPEVKKALKAKAREIKSSQSNAVGFMLGLYTPEKKPEAAS